MIPFSKLSIIIPAYNEERYIGTLLSKIIDIDLSLLNLEKEIIVVDDGSVDRTSDICGNYKDIKIIRHTVNKKKGAAIRTGLKNATGDIILIQDADMEYDPSDYPNLIEPILNNTAAVVYGTRFKSNHYWKNMYFLNFLANITGTALFNFLYHTNITDLMTGYKVFRRDVIFGIDIRSEGFEVCVEITAKIIKKHIDIKDVLIGYYPRRKNEGKKFKWFFCFSILFNIFRYKFINNKDVS